MSSLCIDLGVAMRQSWRARGAFLVAIGSAAVGLGVCIALFGAFDAVLPRHPGLKDPATLVVGPELSPTEYVESVASAAPDIEWAFSVLGQVTLAPTTSQHGTYSEAIIGEWISPNYFEVLGVRPRIGRGFTSTDTWRDRQVLVSDRFCRSHLGGSPACLGRLLRYSSAKSGGATVIGVMPPNFDGKLIQLSPVDVWHLAPAPDLPGFASAIGRPESEEGRLRVFARVPRGRTAAVGTAIAVALARQSPSFAQQATGVWSSTMERLIRRRWTRLLATLMLLPFVVLLIATTNVAILLLSDFESRKAEFSIRVALGCSRLRLLRFVLTKTGLRHRLRCPARYRARLDGQCPQLLTRCLVQACV